MSVCLFQSPVTLDVLWRNEDEVNIVHCGENVKAKLRGVEEADIAPGFVLCDPLSPCKTGRVFDGQVRRIGGGCGVLMCSEDLCKAMAR